MPMSTYLREIRSRIGHDLVVLTAAAIVVFDGQRRILLGKDVEQGFWSLPGGAIDPLEQPADAAARECFEETGLIVRPRRIIGVFGGPEFLIRYPHGDISYYTTIAFSGEIEGGSLRPRDGEMSELGYFNAPACESLTMSPSSRIIARQTFAALDSPYFEEARWRPDSPS